jgi:hypothetical protein
MAAKLIKVAISASTIWVGEVAVMALVSIGKVIFSVWRYKTMSDAAIIPTGNKSPPRRLAVIRWVLI